MEFNIVITESPRVVASLSTAEINVNVEGGVGGVVGSSTFSGLTDTPTSYSGQSAKLVAVKSTEDGLEFVTVSGGGDMLKSVYDTDNSGVVDDAEKLDGQLGTYYLDRANHTGTQTASTISDFDTEVSNNSSVVANTSKITNATHTGEVTGSGALTITDNVIDEANLKVNAPTNDYVLTADSGEAGGMKWAVPSSGFTDPMTTRGDIIVRNASNITDRLGVGSAGQFLSSDGTDVSWSTPSGSGDVVGPASSVDNRIATFNGITGKLIQDGGSTIANVLDRANHTGTQIASTISDFDTEVSNNSDVSANTAARHVAVTVLDTSEIDLTLTGQQISAVIVASSIDETKLDTSVNVSLDLADSAIQSGDLATVATTGNHTDLSNIGTNTHAQIDTAITNSVNHIASTSNPHSVDIDNVTPTTTKGDIIVEDGSNAVSFPVGTDGQVLLANSSTSTGLQWASSSNILWSEITTTTKSASVGEAYVVNNASLVTITLPSSARIGERIRIVGKGAGGWRLAQNTGESIHLGNIVTTSGTSGYLASSNAHDSIELVCITANTVWQVISSIGNITYV